MPVGANAGFTNESSRISAYACDHHASIREMNEVDYTQTSDEDGYWKKLPPEEYQTNRSLTPTLSSKSHDLIWVHGFLYHMPSGQQCALGETRDTLAGDDLASVLPEGRHYYELLPLAEEDSGAGSCCW